jgi:hypothetical protein
VCVSRIALCKESKVEQDLFVGPIVVKCHYVNLLMMYKMKKKTIAFSGHIQLKSLCQSKWLLNAKLKVMASNF